MNRKRMGAAGVAASVALAGGVWVLGHGRAKAGEPGVPGRAERQDVTLTVYANDFAMVRETRPVALTQGANRLHLQSVSKLLDPQSVLLQWEKERAGALPELVSNAYDLGVGDADGLAKRYLGQEVEVVRYGVDGHEAERQKGTLLVADSNEIVLQSEGKLFVHPPGTLVVPTTNGLVTIPQLSVSATSASARDASLDVAYLTRGLAWSADYVGTLGANGSTLDLQCWATVTNRTGVDYPNAKVSLVAGSPNRAVVQAEGRADSVSEGVAGFGGGKMKSKMAKDAERQPQRDYGAASAPESVGEFHAYTIKSPTTVAQEQMNRLQILSSANVPVTKDYSARPPQLSYWADGTWGTPTRPGRGSVGVALSFVNAAKAGLGAALPAGAIRLYEPDKSGVLRYAGAAQIEDTPTDQRINVTLARAFDVFTDWRLTKIQKITKKTTRKTVELTLHNEKTTPVVVRTVQNYGGKWKLVSETAPHTNLDAYDTQWKVSVPAGGKTVLRYTIDLTQ